MAEDKPLSIIIDADISKLQKAISNVRESIGQISSDLKNTDLGDFGKGLEQSLSQINARLDQLEGSLKKTSTTAKTFTTGTKDARTALTSLSLVAQDLPFGFIAIQNNLPNLIQAFGQLDTKTKGLKGVLTELRTSLVGPAGAFLAFSILTSAVTFIIQKFGSFEIAIKSLFGSITQLDLIQKRAKDSLAEYNKQLITNAEITGNASSKTSDQIFKIQTLSEAIKDTTLSETQRKNAIEQIQKLDPKTLENLSLQTKNYKDLDEFVKKYTDSLIANAVAQEYLSQVVATTTQITQQTNVLSEIGKGYADIAKKRRELNAEPIFDPATGADLTNTALGGLLIREQNINEEFSKQTGIVNGLWKQLDNYKNSAKSATIESLKFFKSIEDSNGKVKDILKLDTQELDEAFNLKDIKAKLNEYGNILLDVNNTEKQRKDALNELIAINPEFANTLSLNKSRLNENKTAIESNIRALNVLIQQREFDKRATEINNQFLKEQEKQRDKNIQAEEKEFDALVNLSMAYDKIGNSTDKVVKANNDFLEQLAFGQEVIEMLNKALNLEDVYAKALKNLVNFGEYQQQEIDKIVKDLRFLQEPLEGLFTTVLEGGRENWKAFADDVIKQIKRVTAALLAKSLIKGLANLLSLGSGSLVSAGLSTISDEGIDAWRKLFDPDPTRVNFGGLEGGMQMSGQVVFVQRGSDLVGVLNRTNSTIGRIG